MMRLTSLAAAGRLKDVLAKDFSEPLSSQIIKHTYIQHGVHRERFTISDKTSVINSIVSDYKAIKPFGSIPLVQLKKSLHLVLK